MNFNENPFASTHSLDANPFDDPAPSQADAARLENIRQREADLERRERELSAKAENLKHHGKNNWPFFFPLIYHDISEEIPEASRPLITRLYQLWLLLLATLILNMIACIFILIAGSQDGGRDVGASIGYLLVITVTSFLLCPIYNGYMKSSPAQCQNLSIGLSGSGQPPYNILIVPSGPSPLSNNSEVRKIISQEFSSNSVSFKLNYPAESQFVAVVSDSTGFGSGGTSATVEVISSSDSSCINATDPVSPLWFTHFDNFNQVVQCTPTRIWWDTTNVTGTPSFFGVIPGGESFVIPESQINATSELGTGFEWTPNIREGTTLHVIGNDAKGNGTGGSSRLTVGNNPNNDNSCLNQNSPSSTAGSPAGGSYPTDTSGDSTGGSSSSGGQVSIFLSVSSWTDEITALTLALSLAVLRTTQNRRFNEKPVDLLPAEEGDQPGEPPEYYRPDPFIVPEPTVDGTESSFGRPLSGSERPSSRSGTPDLASTSAGTRKTGAPRTLRPVNIIQHDDAGPSETAAKKEEAPETIELPPAYTNIRK
ncbi:hypothetical protein D9757_007724 [Collybiopsis confluens]|uniref:Uncharacterized protein n=1 Tax=Collybiopsis confluens TaxID=2823264 RepID=A0A8H5H5E1_9AGAR|nr:hypothetical protein D9757_007724 [Collybiopsis confluens]